MSANQMAVQFKQGKGWTLWYLGMYNAVYNALQNGMECDKYDQMPDEKGKDWTQIHSANQSRLYCTCVHLINGAGSWQ